MVAYNYSISKTFSIHICLCL